MGKMTKEEIAERLESITDDLSDLTYDVSDDHGDAIENAISILLQVLSEIREK